MRSNARRRLLIIAGTLFTAIGIVGIFVPILPTTPFLLLAAACYMRSSERFYNRLLHNRLFGAYLSNYLAGRGMPLRVKIWTIALLWATIGGTALFAVNHLAIRIVLILVAICVTVHIALLKTARDN